MRFDRVAVLDWSAARGRRSGRDSIWLGIAGPEGTAVANLPTRSAAEARLIRLAGDALASGERLLLGCDFGFGWPRGFARALTGRDGALAVWDWLSARVHETAGDGTTYRSAAAEANRWLGGGPFWGDGTAAGTPGLPRRKVARPPGLAEHRATELAARDGVAAPKSQWQLAGAGAVGAQTLTGVPVLWRLRQRFAPGLAVWPLEPVAAAGVVLAEVYPSLLARQVSRAVAAGEVADAAQVRLLSTALWRLPAAGRLAPLFTGGDAEEGAILGAGQGALLASALNAEAENPDA